MGVRVRVGDFSAMLDDQGVFVGHDYCVPSVKMLRIVKVDEAFLRGSHAGRKACH